MHVMKKIITDGQIEEEMKNTSKLPGIKLSGGKNRTKKAKTDDPEDDANNGSCPTRETKLGQ